MVSGRKFGGGAGAGRWWRGAAAVPPRRLAGMSQGPSEAAAEREPAEDSFSALSYESDTETRLKKKMSRRPAKSPRSPYTSSTCLHSKRTGFLRSFKGAEIPLVKASRQHWRGSLKQGTWVSQSKSETGIGPALSPLPGSTPDYLKEALGMKKPKHARSASHGYIPGTPDYKEKEDMYDEIIELKKTIQAQKCEADRMKTKLRRLEEENNRKDKQIEQLLDPFRGSEFSWIRTEQKNESSSVINGLKQKILRLEQQCKEKDNTINQLQADVKNTDTEEMTIALQTCYEEIRCLQNLLTKSKAVQRKSSESQQQKVLSTAVFQLSKRMKELQDQNRKLKADLDHTLSRFLTCCQAKNSIDGRRQKLVQQISEGGKKMDDRLWPSEASTALLLPPPASEEVDRSVAKESDLPEVCEPLCKIVEGLRDQRLILQNQLAVKEEEIQQLKENLRQVEENQETHRRQARIDVTQPPDQTPDSSSELCPLRRVVGCKAGEEEEGAAVRLIQSAFRAHITRAQLEKQPLLSSLGREKANLAASREEKASWSIFRCSPLVFTSNSATASHNQRQASPSELANQAESDDSDEIITAPLFP
ncbi:IQ domain-containing protein E isoform 2-T2 [Liasis olivaceus]